jgi:Na+/melibiose symporter-like transporter
MPDPQDPPPITEGPYEPPAVNPWYRWGMLVVALVLLVMMASIPRQSEESTLEAYSSVAVPLMLLFNHLAYCFQWKKRWLSIAWQILAWSWIVIGVCWIEWSARQWRERTAQEKRASAVGATQKIHR